MIFETAAVLIFSSVGYVLVRLVSGFQGIGVCWGLVNVVLLLLLWLLKKGVGGGGVDPCWGIYKARLLKELV